MVLQYTKDLLEKLANECYSYREMIIKTGRNPSGGESYRVLKNKLKEYNIDIDKSKTLRPSTKNNFHGKGNYKYKPSEVFCKNSPVAQSILRKYINRYRPLVYECAICGFDGEG